LQTLKLDREHKSRRLRLPKIHQISHYIKWTKNPDKILTKGALQISLDIHQTLKLFHESSHKDWEFDDLLKEANTKFGP
jgi:hypothetical protein